MSCENASPLVASWQAEPAMAIEAQGLGKRYDIYGKPLDRLKQILFQTQRHHAHEFWALRDVSFTVRCGETLGIVGRNGSGKSTLLQILCGTLIPTTGSIKTQGRIAALLELGAGFNPEFTGRENVYLNAAVLGLSRDEIEGRFAEIESFAEIGEFIDQPVKTYSSGMYVRLAFAVAIHVEPQILIVDEALAVGDVRFQVKCLNKIKRMQKQGVTILFVSHDVSGVRTLCERAIWLDEGRIRMIGDAFPVTSQYMRYLFEGEMDEVEQPVSAEPPATASIATSTTARPEPPMLSHNTPSIALAPQPNFAEPVNHWGSHVGSILEASICDARGEKKQLFEGLEEMFVRIRFRIPEQADRKTLSVAFSIKDLKGTDLIVSTTHDQQIIDFTSIEDEGAVQFRLQNRCNTGKYLLVVALEDRSGVLPHYYEYIEGAQYFASHFPGQWFGIFIAEVEQSLMTYTHTQAVFEPRVL